MCSIIVNKINKDLINIIREYLLPIKEYIKKVHNENTKIDIYTETKLSKINTQYIYFDLKRKYPETKLSIYRSLNDCYTIVILFVRNIQCHMNIYDFPYQDINKIESENIQDLLYDRKNWNNEHLLD